MRFSNLFLISFILLCSCASRPTVFGGDPALEVSRASALPVPAGNSFIGPYDKLSIKVVGIEDLSVEEVQADAVGRISAPLAGTIEARGKTPEQVADEIAVRLRQNHVRNPRVAVNLREAMSRSFTVGGEVREPGVYPVSNELTLLGAIARAKGATEFARLEDVVLFRTVEGKRFAALYNVGAIQRGAYEDPRVYADDVVMVGDSPSRRIFRDVLQSAPALLAPLILILQ